jgi:hypothetical protein
VGYTSRREVMLEMTAPLGTTPARGPAEGPAMMNGTRELASYREFFQT